MSWWVVLALAAGAYLFKVGGLVLLGGRTLPAPLERSVMLLPPALLAAIVVVETFGSGRQLVVDARAAGLAVAVVATWRRAPFWLVVVLAAGVTAAIRAVW